MTDRAEAKELGCSGYDEDPKDGQRCECPVCGEFEGVRSGFVNHPCDDCKRKAKREN